MTTKEEQRTRLRFIFHVSFCGSTLLARLLDTPGSVLCLKEPQALVDVSDRLRDLEQRKSHSIPKLLRFVGSEMHKPGADREITIIKPSNWANNLIPFLCAPEMQSEAVFLSMPRAEFLRAVFRGGRDRMTYTSRAAAHLVTSHEDGSQLLQEAITGTDDPLHQVGRIAAMLHLLQERTFLEAMASRGWDRSHWIDFSTISDDPARAMLETAAALKLDLNASDIDERVKHRSERHSKDPGISFSSSNRAEEDEQVELFHGDVIKRAEEWSRSYER